MDRWNNNRRPFAYRALWSVALMAVILLGSGSGQPATPGVFAFPHFDKVAHFFVFGLIATAVYRTLPSWLNRRALIAVAIVSLFGLLDELRQSFNPERFVEFADWVADTAGAALAVLAYTRWPFYRNLLEWPVNLRKVFRRATRTLNHTGFP